MLRKFRHWLVVAILRVIILIVMILPWRIRTGWGGMLIGFVTRLSPSARRNINMNTKLVYPDWTDRQRKRFIKINLRHFGQNLVELFNIKRFCDDLPYFEKLGDGWETIYAQKAKGEGAIIVSGHFGQWEAIRAVMASEDMQLAGLLKENSNPYFDKMFIDAMSYSGPMYYTGVRGMAGLVRVLKKGGFISLLHDQLVKDAPVVPFLGLDVHTSTAPAELALKYNVPLIPVYGIRREDGFHYKVVAEAPIPPSDALTMTAAMNASLSAMVRQYPAQWLWSYSKRFRLMDGSRDGTP